MRLVLTTVRLVAAIGLFAAAGGAARAQPPPQEGHGHGHGHGHGEHAPAEPAREEESPPAGEASPQPRPPAPTPVPPLTDRDRQAAFPEVTPMRHKDARLHSLVLLDRLEWLSGAASGPALESKGWLGSDRQRLRFRAEGHGEGPRLDDLELDLLYGRAVTPVWDFVAGVRQDFRHGPEDTWLAVGIAGLAPYRFEVEAVAYVRPSGRAAARFEAEYSLLFTNRLILQPNLELSLRSRNGSEALEPGFGALAAGLRLRYEIRREFAPYVGLAWRRPLGGDSDPAGRGARLAAGVRLWF